MYQIKYVIILLFAIPMFSYGQESEKAIGIDFGLLKIQGDIDSKITDGKTFGVHYEQSFNSLLNFEVNYYYGSTIGIEHTSSSINPLSDQAWFPNNKTTIHNLYGAIGIRKEILQNLEIRFQYGPGLLNYSTFMNALDKGNEPYQDIVGRSTIPGGGYDLDIIESILDDTFETKGFQSSGIFGKDDSQFYLSHNLSFRIMYNVNSRIKLGLKSEATLVLDDYLDGIKKRTLLDDTNNNDKILRMTLSASYILNRLK